MAKSIKPDKPDPTPGKQLKHQSGWCMSADHKRCPRQFSFGICGCDCHKENKKQRGRPRKEDK